MTGTRTQTRLVLATANAGKVREVKAALAELPGLEVVSAGELGIHDFPEETGGSYAANALTKASFVMQATGLPSLGDDSGLEVLALDGAPGLYSARFGNLGSDAERTQHLLERLRDVPTGARGAQFVSVLGFTAPDGEARTFEGRTEGRILEAPEGDNGFGYDPVFYSFDLQESFGTAPPEAKARVSHRARALEAFAAWYRSHYTLSGE